MVTRIETWKTGTFKVTRNKLGHFIKGKPRKRIRIPAPPPITPPSPIGENINAITIFRVDYGLTGHKLEFNCWVSRVFAQDEQHKIGQWYDNTKQYIKDKCINFGFEPSLIENMISGIEVREESSNDIVGLQEERFTYSHDGTHWKRF